MGGGDSKGKMAAKQETIVPAVPFLAAKADNCDKMLVTFSRHVFVTGLGTISYNMIF